MFKFIPVVQLLYPLCPENLLIYFNQIRGWNYEQLQIQEFSTGWVWETQEGGIYFLNLKLLALRYRPDRPKMFSISGFVHKHLLAATP